MGVSRNWLPSHFRNVTEPAEKNRERFFKLPLTLALMVLIAAQDTQAATDREALIKTALIVKMAVLVTWPDAKLPGPGKPLTLCVAGNTSLPLSRVNGQRVQGKWRIEVREIAKASVVKKCHMLYIGDSEPALLNRLLDDAKNASVLTFADMNGFVKIGGMVGIVTVDEKVGFELNIDALKQADLKVDVGLYKLAQAIVLHGKIRRRR